ncbi:MAG TPA: histidine kinase N-terminal 7TM domain-containing protein [Candidatus Saccharimonadales bacterium]|nr:histidine kinase N-terminal 7TM domain-containing protein [Candidatus Saccharimonadales bacterium]
MMGRKRDPNTLYCFSPPVMAATFIIEVSLAVYTLWRYKMARTAQLAVLVFAMLATFQLAEFMVCRGPVAGTLQWSRLGYGAIALLPPLGLHLLVTITGQRRRALLASAYTAAAAFVAYFLLAPGAVNGHVCLGNYVIFEVAKNSGALFGAYYYGLLAAALWLGWRALKGAPAPKRRAIKGLLFGYLAFIVPVVCVNLLSPNTMRGIPSIMCGFAVLLALALAFEVLPGTVAKR